VRFKADYVSTTRSQGKRRGGDASGVRQTGGVGGTASPGIRVGISKGGKMKLRVFGAGIAMSVTLTGAALALPATSYASSCYTGCHTSTPKSAGGTPSQAGDGPADSSSAHALAFTGANVILPTGIGAGAILVGGTLVFAGRRRRYRSASL
jgi:hypothetical protein